MDSMPMGIVSPNRGYTVTSFFRIRISFDNAIKQPDGKSMNIQLQKVFLTAETSTAI